MINLKCRCIIGCFLLLLGYGLMAQNGPVAAGLEASGTGGTLSASIGQVAYQSHASPDGSVSEGLQHAFEIFLTATIDDLATELQVQIYPNPTTDWLSLQVASSEWSNMQYQLLDPQGRVLEIGPLQSSQTEVNFQNKPAGTYFIRFFQHEQALQTFKILKIQ